MTSTPHGPRRNAQSHTTLCKQRKSTASHTLTHDQDHMWTYLEDGWLQREKADAALQHVLVNGEITDRRRS
jgi:hypothetical protein